MTLITHSENETIKAGEELGQTLRPGDVVALRGGLGAGKTVFTRGLALGLGLDVSVSSPTFTIVNEYCTPKRSAPANPSVAALFHFDMYRLESEDELFDIGWDDYAERGGVCVVEWSERVPAAFDGETIYVHIEHLDDNTRQITVRSNANANSCP